MLRTTSPEVFAFHRSQHYLKQWHLHTRMKHPDLDTRSSLRCEDAWQVLKSFGDRNVVIGVADDGCRLDHDVFGGPEKFAAWGYFDDGRFRYSEQSGADALRMYTAGHYHGTSICSLIAARPYDDLPFGVAPNCRLLPVRWELVNGKYSISEDLFLQALDSISDQIDVMVNTWSRSPNFRFRDSTIERLTAHATKGGRRGKGIVFVWAAGNSNCPINLASKADIPFRGGLRGKGDNKTWYPIKTARQFSNNLTGLDNVLHVGAISGP